MAKRKAARATGRKGASTRSAASRSRSAAKKAAGRKSATKTAARKSARGAAGKAARKATARKTTGRKATARKATARKATVRKAPARKTSAARPAARKAPARKAAPAARASAAKNVPPRKAPNLNRERRTVQDEDALLPSPPSSLDLDRRASAARSGRRELRERFNEHTETSPQLTGGDVDADWESAYSVGDEAPGGDNPTPDQDIVDDIGRAVGVEYQDNEELKGADKVAKRDKHRWELDPASAEDYDDRD
jgi:hypothetical protein